ncbi:MAG: hypothetical protein K9J12_14850 [Melioribacteraceae bacterium]|nr:hypothetical protein [Melioribacteraceae bacterium]MCF8432426.1 hypothetical protein [Melioribacteraceae bacterium]
MTQLENYNKINRSFKKELIYNLGSEAGFYSEFNNMVFAILFCLKNNYRFILFSSDAFFKIKLGWEDYFEPFCESTNFIYHSKFNNRRKEPKLNTGWKIIRKLYRLSNPDTLLTYQLWGCFFNSKFETEEFDFPELGFKGNLREASKKIVEMIYNFNSPTKDKIRSIISKINLPLKYASVHIRRGDKFTEVDFLPVSIYIEKLKKHTEIKSVFVFTDDYSIIEELQNNYPEFIYYCLVEKNEKGYVHGEFVKMGEKEKEKKQLSLLASMEIICESECFIGTYTANPGIFAGMRMPDEKIHSVQKASWYQFQNQDVIYHYQERRKALKNINRF